MEDKTRKYTINLYRLRRFVVFDVAIGPAVPMLFCFSCYFSLEGWLEIYDDVLFSIFTSAMMSGGIAYITAFSELRFPWLA